MRAIDRLIITISATTSLLAPAALGDDGSISGAVVVPDGRGGIAGTVFAYDESGDEVTSAATGSFGEYLLAGLPPGQYTLRASADGFLDELWDNLLCEPGCDVTAGAPVLVTAGSTVANVDFVLHPAGTLRGELSRSADGAPIGVGFVHLFDGRGAPWDSVAPDADGGFHFADVAPGDYFARTEIPGYADELYDDLSCFPSCTPANGTPITVVADGEAMIAFALAEAGRIEGSVLAADTGMPLQVQVRLHRSFGTILTTPTSASGAYEFAGLPAGSYFLSTNSPSSSPYENQLYDDHGCDPSCVPSDGDPVAVAAGGLITGIDFLLDRCSASSHRVLFNTLINTIRIEKACRTIRVWPDVTVTATGELVLRAGLSVALGDGFSIESGGRLAVVIDPDVASE